MADPTPNAMYRWLQISDLHVFDSIETNQIRKAFASFSKNFHFAPDFLVVTGDYRSLNYPNDTSFDQTLKHLNVIVESLGLAKKDVYLVPGNHDVNDYSFRTESINTIRLEITENANAYRGYMDRKDGNLLQGFVRYSEFVKRFYNGELAENDPRLTDPAKVLSLTWEGKLNLILLNTALISDKDSQATQITDVYSLSELSADKSLPTIVLAHHGVDRMEESIQEHLLTALKDLEISAYLCGDAHKLGISHLPCTDDPNTSVPQFTCGKSTPQPKDAWSDLAVVGYTAAEDGNTYVQAYRYGKRGVFKGYGFSPSSEYIFDGKPSFFPLRASGSAVGSHSATPVGRSVPEAESYPDLFSVNIASVPTELVGRDKEKQEILKLFSQSDPQICWVTGVSGIGKTALCETVCELLKKNAPGRAVLRVPVAGVKSYSAFLEVFAKGLGQSLPDQRDQWENALLAYLYNRKSDHSPKDLPVVYFDNFEDTWDFSEAEISHLNQLLLQIRALGYHLLFSSQRVSTARKLRGKTVELPPLAYDGPKEDLLNMDSTKLFCAAWGREPQSEQEWKILPGLIRNLSGHPLAIVLTANMARDHFGGLEAVAEQWHSAEAEPEHPDDRHTSLKTALTLLWTRLQKYPGAVQFWALQSHSVQPVPEFLLNDLRGALSKEEWNDGMQKLWEYHLIGKDEKAFSMLPPIQKQFALFENTAQFRETALLLWAKILQQLLDRANDWSNRETYYEAHPQVISLMPQIMYVIEEIGNKKEHFSLFAALIDAARNHYRCYLPSLEVLSRLLKLPDLESHPSTLANISQYTADLDLRLGQLAEAERLYEEALPIYEKVQDNLGRANTLQSLGDLRRHLGQLAEAESLYKEALPLYEKVQDDQGRANTLMSMADLLILQEKGTEALLLCEEAEDLYKKEQNPWGQANIALSYAEAYRLTAQFDLAKKYAKKALEISENIQYEVGVNYAKHLLSTPA